MLKQYLFLACLFRLARPESDLYFLIHFEAHVLWTKNILFKLEEPFIMDNSMFLYDPERLCLPA